jgi:hypothetical protein
MALWFRPARFCGVYNTGSDKHARRQYRRTKPACVAATQAVYSPKSYDPDYMCLTSKLRTALWTTERTTHLVRSQKDLLVCSDLIPGREPLSLFREAKLAWPLSFASRRSGQDSGRERWLLDGCAYGPLRPSPLATPQEQKDRTKASLQDLRTKNTRAVGRNCRPTRLRTLLVPLWFLHK